MKRFIQNNFVNYFIIIFVILNYLNIYCLQNSFYISNYIFFFNIFFLLFLFYKVLKNIFSLNNFLKKIIGVGVIIIFILGNYFFWDIGRLEGGHDQGVYTGFAAEIVKEKALEINNDYLFTFPGIHISNNLKGILHFPPLYSGFLSGFYHYLGIKGFAIANILLVLGSIFFISQILELFTKRKDDIIYFLIFFLFSYFTIYFTRAGYVENFLLFFIWSGVFFFLNGYLKKDFNNFIIGFIPFFGITLIRFEFFVYLFGAGCVFLLFIVKNKKTIKFINFNSLGVIISLLIISFISFQYYYKVDLEQFISVFKNIIGTVQEGNKIVSTKNIPYNPNILSIIYIIFSFITTGTLFYYLGAWTLIKKFKEVFIILSLLILPQVLFIYRPGVAYYLPWSFRRYWSGLFVLGIILFVVNLKKNKRIKQLAFVLMFITVLGGAKIYAHNYKINIIDKFTKLSTIKEPIIFYDKYGTENYGNIMTHYIGKKNIIVDRKPLKEKEYYDFFLKNYDYFYIVTTYDKDSLESDFFEKHGFLLKIEGLNTFLVKVENIKGSCDIRRYMVSPQSFSSYIGTFSSCLFSNKEVKERKMKINLFRIKNNNYRTSSIEKFELEDRKFLRF